EEKGLSYRELNNRANQLARVLREKGVGPDKIVGIMVERSLEMIVGIMGILKAGGAYLPIDPEYPKERIEYMLEDSMADILLTQTHLLDKVEFRGEIVHIDREDLYVGDNSNLKKTNKSSNLAYVIYTSGTTGKPKGVMLAHKGILNLKEVFKSEFSITQKNIGQFATICFDASVWEIFMSLFSGSTLKIIPNYVIRSNDKFEYYLNNENINIITLPPIYASNIDSNKIHNLEIIITAGSSTNSDLANKWNSAYTRRHFNAYGPTEATICATMYNSRNRNVYTGDISIGKPISNTRLYIVDKNNKLQPLGVPGELCISGEGLAIGYLNRPELTEEKFIANPYEPGEKMYKTGDLARWLPDGNIEFIGRMDHQVKIRGYRIELGEIESQLLKHEEIKEAVVIDREDTEGNKYLCAYVVSNKEITVTELREHLAKELPDYMIPAYFIQLENIPLTPNGKIDRKALPEPEGEINTGVEYAAPRNEVEEKIVKV
ncbi:MAG: amino acid adenylation domain-containing protein, partial [Bacillota bacterium]|nr:amino acid adenylation domain-containing protein [Bacillota bacterium]